MFQVTVDPLRCEGERDCVKVCPTVIFALRRTDPALPWYVRLKVAAHGGKQAVVAHEDACTGCMACVSACPEKAIVIRDRAAALPPEEHPGTSPRRPLLRG